MPSSPLKRPSAGGRLRRLLASLRPPARAGPLPVQTGFPTSLADLVVKNHGRFHNPRRRHRPSSAPPSPAPAEPVPQQRRQDLSVAHEDDAPAPATRRPKGAAFSVRPELLAVGGALALALLLIWSKRLVAAATLASVALLWIESARPRASRRPPPRQGTEEELGLRGRVSPIREGAAESPRSDSDKGGEAADCSDLGCDDSSAAPKRKEKRRSLRKLLAKKLRKGKRPPRDKDSRHGHGGESEHPGACEVNAGAGAVETERSPAEETTPPPQAVADDEWVHCRRVRALPLAAVVPIILVSLVAGKLPAVALTVLCAVLSSSVERVPDPVPGPARQPVVI